MSQLVVHTEPGNRPPTALSQPLRRLRLRIARWFWLDGICRLAWTLVGFGVVDFLLDHWLRFDRPQRAIMLGLVLLAAATVVIRRLARPLLARLTDDALCLEVEQQHRELGQKLISALQLSRNDNWQSRGVSPTLARAVIQAGADAASTADWTDVLDRRRERRNALLLGAALLVSFAISGLSTLSPLPGIWWRRNLLLADENWPQSTYLVVDGLHDGRLRVPRGESYPVHVSVDPNSRVVPNRVTLEFRPARGRGSVVMSSLGEAQFEHLLQRVIESFELRVAGGDALTNWIPVEMVEPPALGQLLLEVTAPAYTRLPPTQLPAGAGPHAILEGSRLRLNAVANKPLASARLMHEQQEWSASIDRGVNVAWNLDAGQIHSGRYSIFLEDQAGIRPQQPLSFVLQVQPDRAPKVEAKMTGVSGSLLPTARIPLAIRIRDDFAVQVARVVWQSRGEADANSSPPVPVPLPQFSPVAGQSDVSFTDTFDLMPLNLAPGRTLTFVVEAEDNDQLDGPNIGRSSEFLLRIVTPEELRADWLRREKEQRQELEQILRTQEELLTDTRAIAAAETLTDSDRAALVGLSRRQKQIAQQVASIAQRLDTIASEVVNNRLDTDPDRLADRLRRELVAPLSKVAELTAAEAIQSLDEARRTADNTEQRHQALDTGAAAEQRTAQELRTILERMLKAEGFQEAVQLLYEIQKAQQEVLDRTQREKQQRIEAILRGGEKAESKPVPKTESKPDAKPEGAAGGCDGATATPRQCCRGFAGAQSQPPHNPEVTQH